MRRLRLGRGLHLAGEGLCGLRRIAVAVALRSELLNEPINPPSLPMNPCC